MKSGYEYDSIACPYRTSARTGIEIASLWQTQNGTLPS